MCDTGAIMEQQMQEQIELGVEMKDRLDVAATAQRWEPDDNGGMDKSENGDFILLNDYYGALKTIMDANEKLQANDTYIKLLVETVMKYMDIVKNSGIDGGSNYREMECYLQEVLSMSEHSKKDINGELSEALIVNSKPKELTYLVAIHALKWKLRHSDGLRKGESIDWWVGNGSDGYKLDTFVPHSGSPEGISQCIDLAKKFRLQLSIFPPCVKGKDGENTNSNWQVGVLQEILFQVMNWGDE